MKGRALSRHAHVAGLEDGVWIVAPHHNGLHFIFEQHLTSDAVPS